MFSGYQTILKLTELPRKALIRKIEKVKSVQNMFLRTVTFFPKQNEEKKILSKN
jgi:hypothetical protein